MSAKFALLRHSSGHLSHLGLLCLLLLLSTGACFAQAVTSLRGQVVDPSQAVIPGATVTLTSITNGAVRTQSTDSEGNYRFQQLQPGPYSVRFDAPGFAPGEREKVDLLVATPTTIDIALRPASMTEQVQVSTNTGVTVNTTDATLGNAMDERQVVTLPIEGRNVVELLSLQPGVTFLGTKGNTATDSRSGAVNGARADQSNVTLDGVDVNDQNNGFAFNSVLRMTQDSVGEFRVVTSNADADSGRGSGAEISLITKSGTNTFHGSAYEYNRNTSFAANDWFNKRLQAESGLPNKPSKLIRNVFGASVGGPVIGDKLFFFTNYEGRRDAEGVQVGPRAVPTESMRNGFVKYKTASGDVVTLTPEQVRQMDPLHIGENPAVYQVLNSYPMPNDQTTGDGLNFSGFRFANTEHRSYNTYVARFDWNAAKNHTFFWRGNLMNDSEPGDPQFPGQPPASSVLTNNKGFALGYVAVLRPNLVNNFRWGLTRQGASKSGISNKARVNLAGVDTPVAFTRTSSFIIPVHNFADDLSWSKGEHTFQFGTNIRLIDDSRASTNNSFPSAGTTIGWLRPSGIANTGVPLDPNASGFPAVSRPFSSNYNNAIADAVGLVTEGNAVYNYTKSGTALAIGTPVKRDYRWHEYEFYGQDSWKVRPDLTLTAGLRYSYLQTPAEANGTQVGPCAIMNNSCAPYSLSQFYEDSVKQGASGGAASNVPTLSFGLNGRANGRPDFWNPDKADFGPRVAFAFAPHAQSGWLHTLFGSGDTTSIRGGYSLVFDHFGAALINTFDTTGSFGLTSNIDNPPGVLTTATAPRFQGITSFPAGILPPPPAGGFPATPDQSGFSISWGLDSKIKTPYSHLFDLSVQHEFKGSNLLEVSYVGRIAHRLLEQMDVAMPLNLKAGGTDYFTAAAQLAKLAQANVPISDIPQIPYWQQMFAALDGADIQQGYGPLTATQNVYTQFQQNIGNETAALNLLDEPSGGLGAGTAYPAYRYFHSQYSALYAWRSIGLSYYNAMEAVFRHRFSHGLEADINYTLSRTIDWTSQAERLGNSGSVNNAQIINSWQPDQLRGRSDFNMTHQINSNYIWDLPVGKDRRFLASSNRFVDALIGGWQTTGIVRWTSGLPFAVDNGSNWPTNWDIEGFATLGSKIPSSALRHGRGAQRFADPAKAFASFRAALPGESGTRNPLTGDGYFSWDTGLNKSFRLTEKIHAQIRWETFNVTNSVRFDPQSISANINRPDDFGNATSTLTQPRVMQVAGRIEF